MTVEELLLILEECLWSPPRMDGVELLVDKEKDKKFISSMASKVHTNQRMSTKQAYVVLKLISAYTAIIAAKKRVPFEKIHELLRTPVYVNEPYESISIPNEVRYAGDDFLVFKFKFHPIIKEEIKELKADLPFTDPYPKYNNMHRVWIVKVSITNIESIMTVIRKYEFNFDDDLAQYFTNILNTKNKIPEIMIENNKCVIDIPNDDVFSDYVKCLLVDTGIRNAQ
jgi:hypothetical protein